jgi:hypothetical protein
VLDVGCSTTALSIVMICPLSPPGERDGVRGFL